MRALALVMLVASGCIEPGTATCAGLICPVSSTCVPELGQCVTEADLRACAGAADQDPCSTDLFDGFCRGGVCFAAGCGDGVVSGNEACEIGNVGAESCTTLGFYDQGAVTCSNFCQFNTDQCTGSCGDGIVNGPEICDGTAPPAEYCVDFGYDMGAIACGQSCGLSFAGCRRLGWRASPVDFSSANDGEAAWISSDGQVFVSAGREIAHFDGMSWNLASLDGLVAGDIDVRDIWGSSATDVYAIGNHLFHFDGTNWSLVIEGVGNFASLWGSSANDVFAVGAAGSVLHFDGTTWSPQLVPVSHGLTDVWGSAADDVYAVGSNHSIFHYDGSEWALVQDDGSGQVYTSIWGSGSDDIWAVAPLQAVHYDGTSWQVLPPVGVGYPDDIAGVSATEIYVAVNDYTGAPEGEAALYYYDGFNWFRTRAPGAYRVRALASNGERVYASGDDASVFSYAGAGWVEGIRGDIATIVAKGPTSVRYASDDGIIISTSKDSTYIYRRAPGNIFAGLVDTGLSNVADLWVASPDEAWVASSEGLVRAYDGAGWVDAGAVGPSTTRLVGSSANDLVAICGQRLYSNDGDGWSDLGQDFVGISDVVVFADGSGFAVGDSGSIWRRELGAFTAMPSPVTRDLRGVWGLAPDDVYAVGELGTILHYDGSGWSQVASPTLLDLAAVHGSRPDNIYAVGPAGTVISFDGQAWAPVRSTGSDYHSVFVTERLIFAGTVDAVDALALP